MITPKRCDEHSGRHHAQGSQVHKDMVQLQQLEVFIGWNYCDGGTNLKEAHGGHKGKAADRHQLAQMEQGEGIQAPKRPGNKINEEEVNMPKKSVRKPRFGLGKMVTGACAGISKSVNDPHPFSGKMTGKVGVHLTDGVQLTPKGVKNMEAMTRKIGEAFGRENNDSTFMDAMEPKPCFGKRIWHSKTQEALDGFHKIVNKQLGVVQNNRSITAKNPWIELMEYRRIELKHKIDQLLQVLEQFCFYMISHGGKEGRKKGMQYLKELKKLKKQFNW